MIKQLFRLASSQNSSFSFHTPARAKVSQLCRYPRTRPLPLPSLLLSILNIGIISFGQPRPLHEIFSQRISPRSFSINLQSVDLITHRLSWLLILTFGLVRTKKHHHHACSKHQGKLQDLRGSSPYGSRHRCCSSRGQMELQRYAMFLTLVSLSWHS